MVECTGLENRRRLNPSVSSNLTASAISMSRTVRDRSGFSFFSLPNQQDTIFCCSGSFAYSRHPNDGLDDGKQELESLENKL